MEREDLYFVPDYAPNVPRLALAAAEGTTFAGLTTFAAGGIGDSFFVVPAQVDPAVFNLPAPPEDATAIVIRGTDGNGYILADGAANPTHIQIDNEWAEVQAEEEVTLADGKNYVWNEAKSSSNLSTGERYPLAIIWRSIPLASANVMCLSWTNRANIPNVPLTGIRIWAASLRASRSSVRR